MSRVEKFVPLQPSVLEDGHSWLGSQTVTNLDDAALQGGNELIRGQVISAGHVNDRYGLGRCRLGWQKLGEWLFTGNRLRALCTEPLGFAVQLLTSTPTDRSIQR